MTEDVIADFKQFIAATISQQLSDVATKDDIAQLTAKIDAVDQKLTAKIDTLDEKIDDIQSAIGDALAASNEAVDAQLHDYGQRITLLETKPA